MDSVITEAEVAGAVKILHGGSDLQLSLGWFAAECEAAGMRISTFKSEAMVLGRKRVDRPLQVEGKSLLQVSFLCRVAGLSLGDRVRSSE